MTQPLTDIYGRDLAGFPNTSGTLDLDPAMAEAVGIDVLIQSVVRRHVTVKGSDPSSPNDGIDVRTFIKQGLTQQDISSIAAQVQQELVRDQRVLPATTVSGSFNTVTNVLTLTEVIQTAQGPFSLTLAVSNVTVAILEQSK